MKGLNVYTLFSGSKGNCTYVKYNGREILIDAGVCEKQTEESLKTLGTSLDSVTDIFITHDHTDHVRGLESICKRHKLTVHMTAATAQAVLLGKPGETVLESHVRIHPLVYAEEAGEITVISFPTPHDSASSVGYLVKTPEATLGYATDLGYVSDSVRESLCGVNYAVLEANHDVGVLQSGNYPLFLKKRILSRKGHLSNDAAAKLAAYLAQNGTTRFLLAHLSEQNNYPQLAYAAVRAALGEDGPYIAVAEKNRPTRLV